MTINEHQVKRILSALFCLLAPTSSLFSQQVQRVAPTVSNESYGPHQRNVLDLWLAKSDRPTPLVIFFHGGGFMQGSKNWISPLLVTELLSNGISVASVNYRLTNAAPFPAPMLDGARAIQFLRSRAREWNIDGTRFGAIGGSAGAGMALWIGFHDDMAVPASSDLVSRQSTRLNAIVGQNAQSSYDPLWMDSVFRTRVESHPFFNPFFGLDTAALRSSKALELYSRASPITLLTKDDPPVLLYYNQLPRRIPEQPDADFALHHMEHGLTLKSRMDALKIEILVKHADDYGLTAGAPGGAFGGPDAVSFLVRHLKSGGEKLKD